MAEISVITWWLQNPFIPTNVSKRYIQVLPTAFRHTGVTVYVALVPIILLKKE